MNYDDLLNPPEREYVDCDNCGTRLTVGRPAYRIDGGVLCVDCTERYFENDEEDRRMKTKREGLFCADCGREIKAGETYYKDGDDDLCKECFQEVQKWQKMDALFSV